MPRSRIGAFFACAAAASPLLDRLADLDKQRWPLLEYKHLQREVVKSTDLTTDGRGRIFENRTTAALNYRFLSLAPNKTGKDDTPPPPDKYHEETHVVLSLPRSAVLTTESLLAGPLAHFIESPAIVQALKQMKVTGVPATFLFALWYLYQLHAHGKRHADPLWSSWAQHHNHAGTAANALFRWTEDELALLEEERVIQAALEYKRGVDEQYDRLLLPIVTNFTQFFPPDLIDREAWYEAMAISQSHRYT